MAKQAAPSAPPFPFDRDEIVESVRAFWSASPNGDTYVKLGERMVASAGMVQAHPESFVRFGSTDADKRAALRAAEPEREITQHVSRFAEPPTLKDEDAVISKRRILSMSHNDGMRHLGPSVIVEARDRLHKSDPVAKNHPADMVPVASAGLTRSNAVRAKVDIQEYQRVGGVGLVPVGQPVLKGCWIARGDPRLTSTDQWEDITDALLPY
jgi:hypothetical protein